MKAAILIYGMYREFDNCIKRWVDIEKYLDCDYYFSTWNKSEQKYSDVDLFKKFNVTPNMITDYLPNCVYDIIDDDYIFPIKPPYPNSNMLMFHWKNLYKLMMDSGNHYDIVILIRSDGVLSLNEEVNINDWINEHPNDLFGDPINMIITNPDTNKPMSEYFDFDLYKITSNDIMFAGSMDIMSKWINEIPDTTNIDKILHSHFWLATTFKSLKLYPNSYFPFTCHFIRPKFYLF